MTKQEKHYCHDCKKEIKTKGKKLLNGRLLEYDGKEGKIYAFKCNDCYKKDKSLTGFQKCEVYSRVVGFLRPVQGWNPGKQEEYKKRKEFDNTGTLKWSEPDRT